MAASLSELDEVTDATSLGLLTEAINPETDEAEVRQTSFTRFAASGDSESTAAIGVGVMPTPMPPTRNGATAPATVCFRSR